jgi:cytochrome c biogenesis protein CcmG, thiol:disulfide interchange protein DsbE
MKSRSMTMGRDRTEEHQLLHGRRDFMKKSVIVGLLAAVPWWPPAHAEGATRVGDLLPGATLTDVKGARVEIPADYRGKLVLIHFWATWCTYCAKEVALLESLYGRYKANGVIPLSVNVGEDRETVASFVEKHKISYPVLVDSKSSAARRYGVSGIPTTFVLNREGVVKFRIIGEVDSDGLRKIVKSLL